MKLSFSSTSTKTSSHLVVDFLYMWIGTASKNSLANRTNGDLTEKSIMLVYHSMFKDSWLFFKADEILSCIKKCSRYSKQWGIKCRATIHQASNWLLLLKAGFAKKTKLTLTNRLLSLSSAIDFAFENGFQYLAVLFLMINQSFSLLSCFF